MQSPYKPCLQDPEVLAGAGRGILAAHGFDCMHMVSYVRHIRGLVSSTYNALHQELHSDAMALVQGKAAPGAFGRESVMERSGPNYARKLQRYEDGQKVRYFRNEDNTDLDTLVRRSKHGDDLHDIDAAFAKNIIQNSRYRGKEMDVDDEYDVDGGLEMYEDRCGLSHSKFVFIHKHFPSDQFVHITYFIPPRLLAAPHFMA